MAVVYKDECVSCGLPCLGNSCPNRNVPHYYCDECKKEFEADELFITEDDGDLCLDCLLKGFKTVSEKE